MSSGSAKQIKKQAMKEVGEQMNLRLDSIEEFVKSELQRQNERARQIQSFVIQQVTGKIQNDLFNANCTIDAVVEVLAEAGFNIQDFNKKVDLKKLEVAERKKQEAEEKMKAQLSAQQKAAEDAAKAKLGSSESPAEIDASEAKAAEQQSAAEAAQ